MTARHTDVANKVIEILRTLDLPGVRSDEITLTRFPFAKQPSKGLAVSPLVESEGVGLNEQDDFHYPVQLTRIVHELHSSEGLSDKLSWRQVVRNRFNHKRIGVADNELSTTVRFGSIDIPKQWENWNIDASVLIISCLIRETRS